MNGAESGVDMLAQLDELQADENRDFLLMSRPFYDDLVHLFTGTSRSVERLCELDTQTHNSSTSKSVFMIPYSQIAERGYTLRSCRHPIKIIDVKSEYWIKRTRFVASCENSKSRDIHGDFTSTDEQYAEIISDIISKEISTGAGSNFVISREWVAHVNNFEFREALGVFRNLLVREIGSYWIFLARFGRIYFVGASPERHLSIAFNELAMTPISGTLRTPNGHPTDDQLVNFVLDAKEARELQMVLDEELKMVSGIGSSPISVYGPSLRFMSRLVHTEYAIRAHSKRSVSHVLAGSLFAPTVMGAPIENSARVIARHETHDRRYYSGVLGVVNYESTAPTLDSTIMIRTAEISDNSVRILAGSTIVQDSVPMKEASETRAKVQGLLDSFDAKESGRSATASLRDRVRLPLSVRMVLDERQANTASFWRDTSSSLDLGTAYGLCSEHLNIGIVDMEDAFSNMLRVLLECLGCSVSVYTPSEAVSCHRKHRLMFMGPGPGNPISEDPAMRSVATLIQDRLRNRQPFLAVCLSHQILANVLGFPIRRRRVPNQGVVRTIDWFGDPISVGFYNSYEAYFRNCRKEPVRIAEVDMSFANESSEIHGFRGEFFGSFQFHPESSLSLDGRETLMSEILRILSREMPEQSCDMQSDRVGRAL